MRDGSRVGKDGVEEFRAALVWEGNFTPRINSFFLLLLESSLLRIHTFSLRSDPPFFYEYHTFWLGLALPLSAEESHTVPILLAPQQHGKDDSE